MLRRNCILDTIEGKMTEAKRSRKKKNNKATGRFEKQKKILGAKGGS